MPAGCTTPTTNIQCSTPGYVFKLGDASISWGREVRHRNVVHASGAKYILAWRQAFGCASSSWAPALSSSTPYQPHEMAKYPYGEALGRITWLSVMSHPDLALATSQLGQYSANPGKSHWTALMRIFKCLRGIRDIALTLGRVSDSDAGVLTGHTDVTLAQDVDDHHSTSGYIFQTCRGRSLRNHTCTDHQTCPPTDSRNRSLMRRMNSGLQGLHYLRSEGVCWRTAHRYYITYLSLTTFTTFPFLDIRGVATCTAHLFAFPPVSCTLDWR